MRRSDLCAAQDMLMPLPTAIVQYFALLQRYFSFILKPRCRYSNPRRS